MRKGRILGKIFGIALVFVMIGSMLPLDQRMGLIQRSFRQQILVTMYFNRMV